MLTRRTFIKSTGLALVTFGFAPPSFLTRTVEAAGTRRKLLIAIFQRGAVDGLNMIVPFGEAEYYRMRPSIAVPAPGRGSAPAGFVSATADAGAASRRANTSSSVGAAATAPLRISGNGAKSPVAREI